MKNTFINDYRRNVKTKNTFEGSTNDYLVASTKDGVHPGPDSVFSSQEINKSIQALEDEYRIPFTMFLEGYKYKEIADELNLPLGTVKSRIFFTRKKLEKTLLEYAPN
jgi:RNA polymerase sigma-70 factor (ECF subfamily)